MCILEVGIKLDKPLSYYQDLLLTANAQNVYNCATRDMYWTNQSLDGLSENEMKRACVRYRKSATVDQDPSGCTSVNGCFQNYQLFDSAHEDCFQTDVKGFATHVQAMTEQGWKLVFDTYKKDYQYAIGDMKSRIQLQNIEGVGLLLYYDNPDLYHLPEKEQRIALIDELNSYGFDIDRDQLGLDKLRTLYYQQECYSMNQNA